MDEFIQQLIQEILMGRDESPEAQPESQGAQFLRDFLTTGIFGFLQEQARDFQRDPLSTRASASAFERGRPALGALIAATGAAGVAPAGRAPAGFIRGAPRMSRSEILEDFLRAGPTAEQMVLDAPSQVGGVRGQIIEDFLTSGLDREATNAVMEEVIRDRLLSTLLSRR